MKLFEMRGAVPKRAGQAKLQFDLHSEPAGQALPFRVNADIVLPDDPEMEFFPLMGGEQFLLRYLFCQNEQFWFGGTDERPFLVRLQDEPFRCFKQGEDSFYAALKPEIITHFEQLFQVSAKRQGDIFALPIPHSLDEIQKASLICYGTDRDQELKRVKNQPMFGTRHRLNGLFAGLKIYGGFYVCGEGVLEAPDHSPVKLERLHMIVQARNLYQPQLAD